MKRRKLKTFVLPTLYLLIVATVFVTMGFINGFLNNKKENPSYSVSGIVEDVQPVISETDVTVMPTTPFLGEGIVINKDFYSKDDEESVQQNSLIQYENTYMENTGILYRADNTFVIQAVLDGEVVSIKDNEFLGKTVEIKHNNNLSTYYYALGEVQVKEKDIVKAGDQLGTSGNSKILTDGSYLLFEIYYKGKAIDPETFYQTEVSSYGD